jgi:DNA-binding beta-propeller fold protein YncE
MEDYRQLTWSNLWEWLRDPQKRAAVWQIFYHREYTLYDEITGKHHTLDQWPLRGDFRLYVRKDVAARVWNLGVGPVSDTPMPLPDAYSEDWESLPARLSWGSEGSGPGQFLWPRGIAISDDGFIYVADSQNHRIQKLTADGEFVNAWGFYGDCGVLTPDPGAFCEPWDVAIGPDGSVYVADTWAHRIQRFDPNGAFLTQWGVFGQHSAGDPTGQSRFYGPRSIDVAPDGTVYVTDTGNKRVQVFTADGEFLREWGGGGAGLGQLDEPVGLALASEGEIYVADSWNFRVQALDEEGNSILSWPIEGWNNPDVDEKPYLAVDSEGQIYVTDPGGYRVLVFDQIGNYLYSFGQFGFDDVSFALPMGVAVGPDDALYVTDTAAHRIMVFDLPQD